MEQMEVNTVVNDETYGDMIMMARIAAGDGDIYILPKATFTNYAAQGYLVALEENEDIMAEIEKAGLNTERGYYRNTDTNEKHLYGIPVSLLPGLQELVDLGTGEFYVTVITNNGNDDRVLPAVACMIRDLAVVDDSTATATDLA